MVHDEFHGFGVGVGYGDVQYGFSLFLQYFFYGVNHL